MNLKKIVSACAFCVSSNAYKHTGIVITDLDDSDEEDNSDDATIPTGTPDITISSALLDHIKTQKSFSLPLNNVNASSTALVVFRPPLIQSSRDRADRAPRKQKVVIPLPSPPRDDDAMDIEL